MDDDVSSRMVIMTEGMLNAAITELEGERDRARALAAKLEEVVAMRNTVLAALVAYGNAGYKERQPGELMAIAIWAEAQLSEIP